MEETYCVRYEYSAMRDDELDLEPGMSIKVLERGEDGWWHGMGVNGVVGWFPATYVEPISQLDDTRDCIHVVQAIYPFNASSDEELSFAQGERLEVIGLPAADPEWYEARNSAGKIGLIPQTFVLILPNAAPGDSNNNESSQEVLSMSKSRSWLVGPMQRSEAVEKLRNCRFRDTFLVRGYHPDAEDLTISAKFGENFRHFKVQMKENKLFCGGKSFHAIEDVVEHFTKSKPIYIDTNGNKLYLGKPLPSNNDYLIL